MNLSPATKISVTITDIAFGGEGVARVDDFVVFVPFVISGEEVEIEITEVKKSFARAKLVRVIKPSPLRVEPPCPYFGGCGGCQYQHISYNEQLRIKRKQIADLFQRVGGFGGETTSSPSPPSDGGEGWGEEEHPQTAPLSSVLSPLSRGERKQTSELVAPVVPCPQPYGYRNRIMIRSQWNKPEQKLNIGFVRWDCGLVEDIKECKIAEPALNEEIKRVRAHPPPKGGLKVVLRIPPEDWEVPPDSFFQNNFFLLPKMVKVVREMFRQSRWGETTGEPEQKSLQTAAHGDARPTEPSGHLVDVYCGVGFFAIELADIVESYVGVELDKRAIKAARQNAIKHQRTNGEFVDGKAEDVLPQLLAKFSPQKTSVILDPPRKGCAPSLLRTLREVRPSQIIYVSCHPATMARDLNILCGNGVFELAQVVPLDMFPQTQHVECIADLRSKENSG